MGVSGSVGQWAVTEAFRRGEASFIAPFEYTALVWGMGLDWFVWRTTPTAVTLAGASVIIASGIYLVRRRASALDGGASMTIDNVLGGIGNTPLVELEKVVPAGSARIVAKLEWANPTGSMKDRMAKAAIEAAEASGRLKPGGTVVEYTAGTTGISLAFVCAAKGYGIEIVFSDAFSDEKRRMMRAFGARITDVPSENGKINEALIKGMIRDGRRDQPAGRAIGTPTSSTTTTRSAAISRSAKRSGGRPGRRQAFVHSVSTAHSIHGVTKSLWAHDERIQIVAVEPAESAVLSGNPSGSHKIEGIGIGFIPPLWQPELVNEILAVSTDEAKAMARRLAREEGIFAGASTGANVVAAIRVAQRLGPGATVATLVVDSGTRYLSTDVYR